MLNEDQIKNCRSLFLSHLKSIAPVNYEATTCLFNAMKILGVAKRTVLSKRGQHFDKVYFVASGLVEAYYVSENGKKVIHKIYKPGDFMFDYQSHLEGGTSQVTYKTIGDCEFIYFTFEELQQIVNENPELWTHAVKIVMGELAHQQERNISARCEDTTARFLSYMKAFEGYTNQISNKKVSEYLGVTEQGLHKAKRKMNSQSQTQSQPKEGSTGALTSSSPSH